MTSRMHALIQSSRLLSMLLCAALLAVPQLSVADSWNDAVKTVNCQRNASLAEAIARAARGDTLIIQGVCKGPITITNDQLTLDGLGSGVIDGDGQDVVTINAARQVTLRGLTIRHGAYGLIANGVTQLTLTHVTVQDNAASGLLIQGNSSVTIADSSALRNGLMGIDIEGSSSATFTGNIATLQNAVFGIILGTASNATFSRAAVESALNILGIQAGATSNIFINDSQTTITAHDNVTIGVTIVSGSHLFIFGGHIICFNNGLQTGLSGVSVASRSGIDVDAAGSIVSYNNGGNGKGDGVLLQELSLLNIFNAPQFSGSQGFSTVDTHNNAGNGISALGVSVAHMFNQAKILSQNNGAVGLFADDGSSLFVIQSTVTVNGTSDISLSFGARADLKQNTIGQIQCDQTSLIRGDTGAVCPQ